MSNQKSAKEKTSIKSKKADTQKDTKKENKKSTFIKHVNSYSQKIWSTLKRERDVYPVIIFSIIPALTFWSKKNVTELTLGLMLRTFVAAITLGIFSYIIFYFLMNRSKYKASILSIVFLLFSLSYRHFYLYYDDFVTSLFSDNTRLQLHKYFITLLLILFVGFAVIVKRKFKESKTVRNYLALVASILFLFNAYPIVKQWIKTNNLKNIEFGSSVETNAAIQGEKPDIYYLVFDRYANQKVLNDKYGFDNSPFLNSLEKKGFYTTSNTIANYPGTSMSLSSSLNLDYLPDQLSEKVGNSSTILHNAIEDNRVVEFLKKQGYSFINIGPWWNTTKYNKHADKNLYAPTGVVVAKKTIDLKEHEMLMLQDTVFWHFTNRIRFFGRNLVKRTYESNDSASRSTHRQAILHQFETLNQMYQEAGPKFVFSHILLPHDPYVLDENCKFLPKSRVEPGYKNEYELYLKQVTCANAKIQETVDSILEKSPSKPIIILQSDEGPYPMEYKLNRELEWDKQPTDILHQKAGILNSYYFPDENYSKLYPGITPVNTFRLLFNQYLGTDLPLLEDRNYFPGSRTNTQKYQFIDVTDQFKN